MEEEEEVGQHFQLSCQQLSLLTGETGQTDLFGFLLGILKPEGKKRGERRGRLLCVFSFSTLDLVLRACYTRMNAGTHEKRRESAGEWAAEWLTIRMRLSGRLL